MPWISLPLTPNGTLLSGTSLPPNSSNSPDRATDLPGGKRAQPAKLLWIDDEIGHSDAVVRLLEEEGFSVDCASSGAAGLSMVSSTTYLGIILDLRLPDLSGLTVLETLARQKNPAPVLVLTGYPDFETGVQAMRLGAWDCQSKTILLGDDWTNVVRALAEHGDTAEISRIDMLSVHAGILRELLRFLDETSRGHDAGHIARNAPHDLAWLRLKLLRTLADKRVNVLTFLVLARAISLTKAPHDDTLPRLF
jgi:DNA-binding response OmpR family regulator